MLDNSELLKLHTNQRLLIMEMQSRGINVDIIYKDIELIKAEYGKHIEWILDRDSSITPYSVSIICGDKYITKKILEQNEITVPIGEKFLPNEWELSVLYARKIEFPVVVKPVFGSHGDNIYMDIENENELKDIVQNVYAKTLKTSFIIEKQFDGNEYRVFLTKEGKYAVLHREPAHVIGDIYQISNNQTLGITEKEIVTNLENITKKVMEQERLARKYLLKNSDDLEDKVYRSFGILTNARKLSSQECDNLLSDVKLGTDLGIIEELDDSKVKELMLYTKPANLQKRIGKLLEANDRDKVRTTIVKQIIKKGK